MIRAALLLCIGLCSAILAVLFAASGWGWLALISAVIGLAWLSIEWRGLGQMALVGMVSVFALAAVDIIYGMLPYLAALAAVLALSAWDLSRFHQRLMAASQETIPRSASIHHLLRLLIVNAVGLSLSILAMGIQLHIGFYVLLVLGGAVFLAIYVVLGLIARLGWEAS
jgi:hypothetical protein